jgi:hypothetical protein
VSRAEKRNQPCCIKIVKWFYSTLVAKSFVELAYRVLPASVKSPRTNRRMLPRNRTDVAGSSVSRGPALKPRLTAIIAVTGRRRRARFDAAGPSQWGEGLVALVRDVWEPTRSTAWCTLYKEIKTGDLPAVERKRCSQAAWRFARLLV